MLPQAPTAVTLTFTEQPEPTLSVIHVLDEQGRPVERGPAQVVAGQPSDLTVPLSVLPPGAYTVVWRTVSRIDGHVAAGTFSFGVGVAPAPTPAPQPASPPPSLLYVCSRVLLYLGLAGLLSASVADAATRWATMDRRRYWWGCWLVAAIGLGTLGVAQARDAGTTLRILAHTPLGGALVWRALPLAAVPLALVVAARGRNARGYPSVAVGVLVAAAMLAHVIAGHAGAGGGPWRWWNIVVQWVHFGAVGAWIGAVAALWRTIRTRREGQGAATVRRLSMAAAGGLTAIAVTGTLRTADEVGSWPPLLATEFGRLVLVKTALLILLALLGALGRHLITRRPGRPESALRAVTAAELVAVALAFAATAFLTGLPVPSATGEAQRKASVVAVTGSDYATSVRVRLTVTPGRPGVNRFAVGITDYDTRRPVVADRVTLRFTKPDRADIAPSSVSLARAADATYRGEGSNLSLAGPWSAVVMIQRGAASVEVPLQFTLAGPAGTTRTIQVPGAPPAYRIDLSGNRTLTITLDPGLPGFNVLHGTFLDAQGRELPLARAPEVTAARGGEPGRRLPVLREGPGHFTADADLGPGEWRLDISATIQTGEALRTSLTIHL